MLASDEQPGAAGPRGAEKEMVRAPRAVTTTRRRRSPRSGRSGAASCSGSRSPTCSALVDVAQVGYALTDVMAATLGGALVAASRAIEAERRARCRPGWRSSRWAGSAAASSATAATPTSCSCTSRSRAPTGEEASRAAKDVANELRRLLTLPGTDPALDRRRRPAARGQAGPAGAHRWTPTRAYYARWSAVWEAQALLRAEATVGDRGPVPRASSSWSTRCASRPSGISEDDVLRGTPDQGPRRRRAAAARGRPGHPPQARPRRAGRRRVDRPAAPDAARRRRRPGCGRPGPWTRSRPRSPPTC